MSKERNEYVKAMMQEEKAMDEIDRKFLASTVGVEMPPLADAELRKRTMRRIHVVLDCLDQHKIIHENNPEYGKAIAELELALEVLSE